jgi:hypothetical protein
MEAKVIKIIDDYRIVLNVGSNDRVTEGMLFQIIEKQGEEILDPDTGESYGTLDIVKATLRVIAVYPKMCICTNSKSTKALGDPLAFSIAARLNVNLNQVSGGYNQNIISPIQLGDLAYKK